MTAIRTVSELVELYETWGPHRYDEVVSQLDHATQCAALARRNGEPDHVVVAALLHDVGHLVWMATHDDPAVPLEDTRHEDLGADALAELLPEAVTELIRLHVEAKRVLISTDAAYADGLSPASVASARRQGGPAQADEVSAFVAHPCSAEALRLRRIDDAGKVVGLDVRPFSEYVPMIESLAHAPKGLERVEMP